MGCSPAAGAGQEAFDLFTRRHRRLGTRPRRRQRPGGTAEADRLREGQAAAQPDGQGGGERVPGGGRVHHVHPLRRHTITVQ